MEIKYHIIIKNLFAVLLICCIICGCSVNHNEETYETHNNIEYTSLIADWQIYSSIEDVAGASSNIFTGTLINVSYDFLDLYTGKSIEYFSKSDYDKCSFSLHTIYEIEVDETYKGTKKQIQHIALIGGIQGYGEDQVNDLYQNYFPDIESRKIPLLDCKPAGLIIGNKYLFFSYQNPDYTEMIPSVPNPQQFAFEIDNSRIDAIKKLKKTEDG